MEISATLEVASFIQEMQEQLINNSFDIAGAHILEELQNLHPDYDIQTVIVTAPQTTIRLLVTVEVHSTNQYPMTELKNDLRQMA